MMPGSAAEIMEEMTPENAAAVVEEMVRRGEEPGLEVRMSGSGSGFLAGMSSHMHDQKVGSMSGPSSVSPAPGSGPVSLSPGPFADFKEDLMSGSGSGFLDDTMSDKKDKKDKDAKKAEKELKKAEKEAKKAEKAEEKEAKKAEKAEEK